MKKNILLASKGLVFALLFVTVGWIHSTNHCTTTLSSELPVSATQTSDVKQTHGLHKLSGKYYYFLKDGSKFNQGFKTVIQDGQKYFYYFKKDGSAYTDGLKKVRINDQIYYYYFGKNGRALTNRLKSVKKDGQIYYYYFGKTGRALTSRWKTVDDKTYYFGKIGRAYTGSNVAISHYICHFDKKGVLIRRIDKNKPMVALTFDDGPSPYSPIVLDTLEKYHSVATFFVVGYQVNNYASTIKRAKKLGCEIGNHTYDHKILTQCSTATMIDEYTKTNQVLKQITGEEPVLFRPPGGNQSAIVHNSIPMPFILWSVDTLDWKYRNVNTVQANVLNNAKDGDIILVHDLHKTTAEASKIFIPGLINRGYQLVTVSELAACRGVKLKNGTNYSSFRK